MCRLTRRRFGIREVFPAALVVLLILIFQIDSAAQQNLDANILQTPQVFRFTAPPAVNVTSAPQIDPEALIRIPVTVVDDAGQVVGGLRAKALRSADDSHAVAEWAGQPGQRDVRQMIADRVPYGVLEMKAGWVTDAAGRNPFLTSALARSGFYMMVILDFQYLMCTAATAIPRRWSKSKGWSGA